MALFSIFSKQKSAGNLKAKSSRQSVAPTPSISSPPSSNLLELKLVSPLLLSDATPTLIGDTIPSTPSTPGLVGASPWISVDALEQDEKARERASLDKEREEKRLGRAVLELGSVIELIQECGGVIRERGLTTLGIFRPYRFAESPNLIRKLCLLFLAYSQDFDNAEGVAQDIWGTRNSKPAKLAKFRYELKYAGVHDAVGVLKWGLRHISPTAPFSSTSGPPSSESSLLWFTDFLAKSASRSYPASSYNAILLPSLPPVSQKLLQEVLPLLESISAHSEVNAITYRKLSRTLGMYVFGLASPTREWRDWEQLYLTWREAGDVLEGCFKAYLRNQRSLPKRLREIVQVYPSAPERGRKIRVIRIEVESQGDWRSEEEINDQKTGYQVGGIGGKSGMEGLYEKRGRREPLEILRAAFQASSANLTSDHATRDWKLIVEQGNVSGYVKRVLGDETSRVLELVGLDNLPSAASKDERDSSNLNTPTKRSRSISAGGISSTLSPYSNLTSGSRPQNGIARGKENAGGVSASTKAARRMTPSWSDFASTGFAEKGLLFETSEFGLVKPQPSLQPPSRSNSTRLVRATSRAKSQPVHTTSDSSYPAGLALTDPSTLDIPSSALPIREEISVIVGIRYYEVDEEFADVWLDTLVDGTAAASWPSFILSAISPSLVQRINALHASTSSEAADHILVIETLIPYKSTDRATSITSNKSFSISSKSRRPWNQRVSGIFTSSNSMRSKMSASRSNASDLTLKAMNSNVPSLPTTPTMKPRPLRSNHYDTFDAIPELPTPTASPTKLSSAFSPSIGSKPSAPSPSRFPPAAPRSREASASPSAFSNILRSNNTSSASLTSSNGLASTSAFTPPRPLKNPSRTSLSSIRTILSDPKMRMENDIPVRSTDSPTASIFGSRIAEVGTAVVAAGAVSEVVSDSKREVVSVPAAEERTTMHSDLVPLPAQSIQGDETSPTIEKESVPEIDESSPVVSLSPVDSEIKGVVTTERPLEEYTEIHTGPATALEEHSLPTPVALATEVPLPETSASTIKAVAVDELPAEHTEIAASTVDVTSNSSVPLPESLEVKPTDIDPSTPAAEDKKVTTYAPILIAPSPAFLAPVIPSKATLREEREVSMPDKVVQEASKESEIDKVEPGPSAPQDLIEDRDDEDRSNALTATEVPSQVAPTPAIIDSEAVLSVQAISASSPTSIASPAQSETILSSSPTMSSPGTPRKLSRIPIPSTPTPTKSMLGSPASPLSLTTPSQTPISTIDSSQRTLSPAMGSPTTSITPTKKITRVLSGLLRKKSPEEKRFIADSKVEKEKERALRETQKKEKKEEAKIAPEPVSSVRKRVLEIEAEEAAKLESHSRMSSISEGNAALPTGLIATVPEVSPIQHIEEQKVQEDSKEELLEETEETEEKSVKEKRSQKQVNRESTATLGLEDPLTSLNARPLSVATVTSGSISPSKLVADDIFSPSHSKIHNSPSTSTITPLGLPKTLSVAHTEGLSDKDINGLDSHPQREDREDSESGRSGERGGSFSSDISTTETANSFQTAEDLGAQ